MCEGDTEKTKHDLPHLGQGDDSVGKVLEIQARGRCEFAYVIKKKKTGFSAVHLLYSYLYTGEVETDIPWDLLAK